MRQVRATRGMARLGLPGGSVVRAASLCLCLVLLGLMVAPGRSVHAQEFGLKDLQGKVLGANDKPVNGAIVYLQNSRNSDIKTFISESDGTYRFAGLSADTDYTVWAAWKGKKSSTKTVSSFDTRKHPMIDLHIK